MKRKNKAEALLRDRTKLKVNKSNLNSELSLSPARMFKAGCDKADLEEARDKVELELKIHKAKLARKVTRQLKEEGEDTKVQDVKDRVNSHPSTEKLELKLIRYKKLYSLAETKHQATVKKQEAIINIGFNVRKEMDQNIAKLVRKQSAKNKLQEG
jgi:hypothetical protein